MADEGGLRSFSSFFSDFFVSASSGCPLSSPWSAHGGGVPVVWGGTACREDHLSIWGVSSEVGCSCS